MILVKECIQDLRQECNVQIQKELTDKIWEQKEKLKTQQQINEAQENILVGINKTNRKTFDKSESRVEEIKKEETKKEEVKVIEEEVQKPEAEEEKVGQAQEKPSSDIHSSDDEQDPKLSSPNEKALEDPEEETPAKQNAEVNALPPVPKAEHSEVEESK